MSGGPTRRHLVVLGGASALGLVVRAAHAQAWPSKPVRLVVPFAPGGSSEIVARSPAVELGKLLGQSVYVDNKPGGAGNVAMAEVARADDQHTLILGHIGTLAVNPYIFAKLPVRPGEGLPADLAARQGAEPLRRAAGPAGEEPDGVRRAREGQAGPAELRLGRQRQRRPPGVRVPEDGEQHLRRSTCRIAAPARS